MLKKAECYSGCCSSTPLESCVLTESPLLGCRFALQGLGCASCAGKIEQAVRDLPEVLEAQLNFNAGSLRIDSPIPCHELLTAVREIVERFEPGVAVRPWAEAKTKQPGKHIRLQLWRLGAGLLLLLLALVLDQRVPRQLVVGTFLVSYLVAGGSVLLAALTNLKRGGWFDEHLLMSIATLGALALGEYPEAVAVMLFYLLGEIIQGQVVDHSRREIAALLDIRPDSANLLEGEQLRQVLPDQVEIGQMILVRSGERVPLDGVIVGGESLLDSSALTGESRPRRKSVGDEVLAGMINGTGSLTLRVVRPLADSALARIIKLVEQAGENKAKTEQFITRFARIYTPIVVLVALSIAVLPSLLFGHWQDWIYRALIFLVVSCPCALVISIPLGFFGGIGRASKQGILVKGGNFLEALAQTDTVIFDKTGTLTRGVFAVQQVLPAGRFAVDEVLELAALAEIDSSHPIGKSIREKYGQRLERHRVSELHEEPGQGITLRVDGCPVFLGNRTLLLRNGITPPLLAHDGTLVHLAVKADYAGSLLISDQLRTDAAAAVLRLRELGVRRIEMLSGDQSCEAQRIAEELGLDGWRAELLPAQKLEVLEELMRQPRTGRLIMVGDGINDAPVLARADVGVAMGGLGSDAAIEASDVVLMTDQPGKLATAIETARLTRRIVWQNISLAIFAKGLVMLLGILGLASIWQAIFADVGVAVLAVLNAVRIIRF